MGQIVGTESNIFRCNLAAIQTGGSEASTILAADEVWLVDTTNSLTNSLSGYCDAYIVGNGTTAATALELHKFKAEELDEQINGEIIITESEEEVAMLDDKYVNTSVTTGPPASREYSGTLAGTKCNTIAVNKGDVIRIYGIGNTGAVRQWGTMGDDRIFIRKSSTTDSRTNPVEVTIEDGETYISINLLNYADGDRAIKIVKTITRGEGIVDDIAQIENDVTDIKDDIEDINGTTTTDYIPQTLSPNTYINMSLNLLPQQYSGTMEGVYSCMVFVEEGERYNIVGVGTTVALGLYAFADEERNATYMSGVLDTRNGGLVVTIPEGVARLYVNLCNYDSTTDKVEKITTTQTGGYKGYTDEKVAEVADYKYPLLGKTIVCFGDSITEVKYNGKSYTDWIAQITGATVINVGVGGSQIRQRTTPVATPTTSAEAYAALDICNIVKAACEQDFSYAQAGAEWTRDNASDDNTPIIARLQAIDWTQVYMVTIFGGTNDWRNGIGHRGTSGSTDNGETLGAINNIIAMLSSTYPNVVINWISPIVRWLNFSSGTGVASDWSDTIEMGGLSLRQFSEMLGDEVVLNHIPFIDLYNKLGWNMANFSSFFGANDGTHPTKGLEVIGKKLARIIASINPY